QYTDSRKLSIITEKSFRVHPVFQKGTGQIANGDVVLCKRTTSPLPHDLVILPRCYGVHDGIEHREYGYAYDGAKKIQWCVGKVQGDHQFFDHLKGDCHMEYRHGQGQEEYGQHLASDGASDFPLIHADFLHDLE